jgi:hypothetical protein
MSVNPMTNSYIQEMEELIVSVLGDIEPAQIAAFSGCSEDKAQKFVLLKNLVKVNQMIKLQNKCNSVVVF